MGLEDQIREIEAAARAAKAADTDRAQSEQRGDQVGARQANEALRKLACEALPSIQRRNKGLGLEIEPFKRFGSNYGIHARRKIWLLPKPHIRGNGIPGVGFLDDATPVWASPGIPSPAGSPYNFNYAKYRERVLREVQEGGCVVAISSVSPIVALGTAPVYAGYDNVKAQRWGFYLNHEGRLTYGYESDHGSEVDVESYFAQCIAEGTVDSDW